MNAVVIDAEATSLPLYEAEMLEHQAEAKCQQDDWSGASKLLKRSIELRRKCAGETNPDIARTLDKLAITLLKLHLPEQAEAALSDAEKILESAYYSGHGYLAPVLEHHADCLIEEGRFSQAEELLKRAQEIYAKTRTMENRDTLRSMLKLARLYIANSKPADAEAIIAKAMKHVDTPLGPVVEFRYQLALAYIEEGKVEEAQMLLDDCVGQFKQRHNYGRVADCLETYATIAPQSDGSYQRFRDEAEKYRKLGTAHPYPQDIFLATLMRA